MLVTETFLHDWTGQIAAPLTLVENHVKPDWVDEYGHLNMAHYLTICDQANWAFWNWINAPDQTIEARGGAEYVIVENHVTYGGELAEGDVVTVETRLLAHDDKRAILFHRVLDATGAQSATNEVKLLAFDLTTRRACRWPPRVADRLDQIAATHASLPAAPEAGRAITLKSQRA